MDNLSDPSGAISTHEVIADGFSFCEAPRADGMGRILFSDFRNGGFYRASAGIIPETILADRLWIGGAVLNDGGGFVCSGQGGLVLIDAITNRVVRPLLTEISGRPISAINDIEADEKGGIFGGTIDADAAFVRGEHPSGGQFFHLAPDGTVTILRDDVTTSNGIGFSPDGTKLYHSESGVGVWVWERGADGLPFNRRLFAPLTDSDGLAVDAEGGLWVALWKQATIIRLSPDGRIGPQIELPYSFATSLTFGGHDMRDLFVTTGSRRGEVNCAGVIRMRVDVPGMPTHKSRFR